MATRSDVKEAKIHKPEENFGAPGDVVVDPQLSLKDKKKALETLEQDAHQLSTASNEGMAPETEDAVEHEPKLDEVGKAQHRRGVKPLQKHAQ